MKLAVTAILISLIFATHSLAWSAKEHIQLTRLAVAELLADPKTPPAMKDWLRKAVPNMPAKPDMAGEKDYFMHTAVGKEPKGVTGLLLMAVEPDNRAFADPKDSVVEPFGVHERLLHYIDLELFITGDGQRVYKHDLSNKPKLEDISRDPKDPRYQQAGMLPFAVEHCYKQLVKSIQENRLDETPDSKDDNAVKWAGYLAHYVEDNTQPLHATIDYQCETYFAQKRKAPKVHFQLEYVMADDEKNPHTELRKEFWPLFTAALASAKDPYGTKDPWTSTLQVSLDAYDAIPLVGLAAMKAARQAGTPEKPTGPASEFSTEDFYRFKGQVDGKTITVMEMKARQQALAVKRVAKIFRQAWDEAHAEKDTSAPAKP